ncbi:MAG: mechanosensitive ion channel family protein [Fermentimonas sp.]|jgi:small conductance mechanosensitive channel
MFTLLQTILPVDSLILQAENRHNTFGQLIKEGRYDEVADNLITWSIDLIGKLLIAIAIFFVGRFLIRQIDKLFTKLIRKSKWDSVLRGFVRSIIQTLLYIALIMVIINSVGVKTASIAAIIGTVGLAIGLAMKDNLANFAGGVLILLSKPFKGGDYIVAQNLEGTVESIGILHTILRTGDNKTVYIPNGPLSTGNITNNNSFDGTLRTEIIVNVDYGANIEQVKQELMDIINKHPKALQQPEPFARMTKINPTSLEFTIRVWAYRSDLWGLRNDLTEEFYTRLYQKGMITPHQKIKVNMMHNEE